jgi:hypothetical protein
VRGSSCVLRDLGCRSQIDLLLLLRFHPPATLARVLMAKLISAGTAAATAESTSDTLHSLALDAVPSAPAPSRAPPSSFPSPAALRAYLEAHPRRLLPG